MLSLSIIGTPSSGPSLPDNPRIRGLGVGQSPFARDGNEGLHPLVHILDAAQDRLG